MEAQSESHPITGSIRGLGPIISLVEVEARTSLHAVLEGVDKDLEKVGTSQIGAAVDNEFGMYANCRDVGSCLACRSRSSAR